MLAQSAKRAGLRPLVIDLFGDQDTLALSTACFRVRALTMAELSPLIQHMQERYPVEDAIYGSGLEQADQVLDRLQEKFRLRGNTPDTFRRVLDKKHFFQVLRRLHIDFPEVAWSRPTEGDDWLLKPCRGQGGVGIQFCSSAADECMPGQACYWQRWIAGQAMSALFLADRKTAALIGFNRQQAVALDSRNRFIFSGVLNGVALPGLIRSKITDWIARLVPALALTGLNSLDFIWDGRKVWALEVNARPSASMLLYDAEYPRGLLWEQLHCDLAELAKITARPRGWQILYAPEALHIPADLPWPEWTADRPPAGSLIHTHQPICSIIATGNCPEEVSDKLCSRVQIMIETLRKGR